MRIAHTDLHNIAEAFHERRHVDGPDVGVANAEFAVGVGAHGVDVAPFIETGDKNSVVVSASDLRNLNVKAADLGDVVRDALFADAELAEVVV